MLADGVRTWFEGIGQAQDARMSFDEAIDGFDGTPADGAYRAWNGAVEASRLPPRMRRKSQRPPRPQRGRAWGVV